MELRQLRAVVAIADTGSVTKAAAILNIVQPALSRQVRLLEDELGKALFRRTRYGMETTNEGRILVEYAREALLSIEKAETEIRPPQGVIAGLVSVGFLPSVCDLIAGEFSRAVTQAYPNIRLRMTTGSAWQLQTLVADGNLDMAILFNSRPNVDVESTFLLEEPLFLVGLERYGQHWQDPEPIKGLSSIPLILPSAEQSMRGVLEHACAVEHVTMRVKTEADATQVTKALLLAGEGCTVLPGISLADASFREKIIAVRLGQPPLKRQVALCMSTGALRSGPSLVVKPILEDMVRRLVCDGRWPGAVLWAR